MVSTFHKPDEVVLKERKRPRVNATNKKHVNKVWGNHYSTTIEIPKVINDYNNWMLGVDRADQLISNYRHQLRSRRIWMPLFFHSLDLIRINSWIAFNECNPGKEIDQKDYVMAMVQTLLEHAM